MFCISWFSVSRTTEHYFGLVLDIIFLIIAVVYLIKISRFMVFSLVWLWFGCLVAQVAWRVAELYSPTLALILGCLAWGFGIFTLIATYRAVSKFFGDKIKKG